MTDKTTMTKIKCSSTLCRQIAKNQITYRVGHSILMTALFLAIVVAEQAQASILIANFDFESPAVADGVVNTGAVPNWGEGGNGIIGTYNPNGTTWYLTDDDEDGGSTGGVFGTMDGPQVGFFFQSSTGQLSQTVTLGDTLVVGETYDLTVAIGERDGDGIPVGNGPFAGYVIELLSGGTSIAAISGATSPGGAGTFSDVTLRYTATALDPVGTLGVRIGVLNAGHLDIDNVRLTPEPSSLTAIMLGSGILALCRRRAA